MSKAFEDLVRDIQSRLHTLFLKKADHNPGRNAIAQAAKIPWSWVAVSIAEVLSQYPTGLTDTVLLSILELMWEKTFIKRFKGFEKSFSTIQAVYDCSTAETFILEVKAKSFEFIQGAKNYLITVIDESNSREMDIYMHPKFNQWIDYAQQFFVDRKIRMICPPKANAPILTKYKDTTIPRRFRVALIPPTDLLLIMLNRKDREFVLHEFPDKIRDKGDRLWLKIIHVEIVVHNTAGTIHSDKVKLQRTDIFLVDMSSDCTPVVLSLYDKQTQLASIFRRNDYIGLYHPSLQTRAAKRSQDETVFEYANDTVIFLMPEKEAQEAGLAKINLTSMVCEDSMNTTTPKKDIAERDEEGFMDCSTYVPRIFVQDLEHCMLNVTLLGKVIGIANNNPFIKTNGQVQRMDRYALRIADSTGTMDITLWEDAGRDSRRLRVGQYVLLDHLVTSDRHEVGNKQVWYVNGSVVCGTKMYNISTLNCLLSSSSFRSITPLWHVKEKKNDHFQVEGIIVGWDLYLKSKERVLSDEYASKIAAPIDFMDYSLGDRITTLAHASCLIPTTTTKMDCEFCGCQIGNDVVHIFRPKPGVASNERGWEGWLEWTLDDGTSQCKLYGGEETLLNVTADHFRLMSHQSQIQLLNSVIGTSILCSLSGSSSTYRLNQVVILQPTQQECRDMLEIIDKK